MTDPVKALHATASSSSEHAPPDCDRTWCEACGCCTHCSDDCPECESPCLSHDRDCGCSWPGRTTP